MWLASPNVPLFAWNTPRPSADIPASLWSSFHGEITRNTYVESKCFFAAILVPTTLALVMILSHLHSPDDDGKAMAYLIVWAVIVLVVPEVLKAAWRRRTIQRAVALHEPKFQNVGFEIKIVQESTGHHLLCRTNTVIVISRIRYQEPKLEQNDDHDRKQHADSTTFA